MDKWNWFLIVVAFDRFILKSSGKGVHSADRDLLTTFSQVEF